MNIAQIAPNWGNSLADSAYGIMAVVRDLTRGLTARGHTVTVFAADGCMFPGHKVQTMGPSLKSLGRTIFDPESVELQHAYARRILPNLHGFDLIHSHMEHIFLPYIKDVAAPVVSTIHGASFSAAEQKIFESFSEEIYVALSARAIGALPYIRFGDVVYNGVAIEKCPWFGTIQPPGYLAWMGRFAKNKGALDAIAVAKKTNQVLTLMGIEQKSEQAYYKEVQEEADGAMVRVIGHMLGSGKYDFMGNAKALLFPIHWEEPFGLVMVEAMATGTPVIAYNRGSVSEILVDGVTGFIIDEDDVERPGAGTWRIKKKGIEGMEEAIQRIGEIDRAVCRKHVEKNFTIERMVDGYEKVYTSVLQSST